MATAEMRRERRLERLRARAHRQPAGAQRVRHGGDLVVAQADVEQRNQVLGHWPRVASDPPFGAQVPGQNAEIIHVDKRAVILAGGKGTRLAPYTTVLPKPLMPIGERAILDVVVRQLSSYGYHDLTFAVGYLAHLVRALFGDGSEWGVSIQYHEEATPLGTAGPLALIEGLDEHVSRHERRRADHARLRASCSRSTSAPATR